VAWLSGHYRYGLIAADRQTTELMTAAAGAVVVAVLVPVGYSERGPEGAAMGLVVADIVVWVSAWWFGRRRLGLNKNGRLLVRPALAALFVSGLLWSLPVSSWVAQAIIAGVSMTALAFLIDARVRNQFYELRAARGRAGQLLGKQLPEVTR
jgi:O-antigen/teichoic acid export membrane protein